MTLDEHLTFDRPEPKDSFSDSWNFNDGTIASTDNVAVKIGSTCDLGTLENDTANTTSVLKVVKSSGNFEGPRFTLVGKAADYGKVTYSWKMKYDYSSNYTNVFRILKSDGSYANLFRVTGMAESTDEKPNPTATAELFANGGTGMGTLKHGIWNEFKVTVYPSASKITVNINGKITQINTNSTAASILKDLRTNDKELSVMLYAQYGPATEVYIDDVSIAAEPVSRGGDDLLDFEELTVGNTLSDEMISGGISDGLFSLTTDGDGKITAAADPADASNKVIYNTNRKMYLDFLAPSSAFEKLKLSFDVRFENMGGFTSFMSSYACGAQGNFLRVKSEANALQNASDSAVIATLTQGADAKWYSFDMDIVTSTGAVALTVTERDSGTSVGTYSWTDANIKNSYTGGEALGFRIHYCWNNNFKVYFDNIYAKASASVVERVNSSWNDSTFTMTTSPDISGMANDDWEIATDPILLRKPVAASWDFNDSTVATKNNITVTVGKNYTFAVDSNDTVNTTTVMTSNYPSKGTQVDAPIFSLPGSINDYETITVKFKMRLDYASGWVNLFRVRKAVGGNNWQNIFRIKAMTNSSGSSVNVNYLSDNNGNLGTMYHATWIDYEVIIDPANYKITTVVGGKETVSTNNSTVKTILGDLISGDKPFEFMLYYQYNGIKSIVHFDDVSISAKYKSDYTENDVLKTVTDTEGNTRGIFVIKDAEKYLTTQPFELSFDYMMNQKPSGYLNFVKMKMTGTSFAVFRLDQNGNVCNYTSSGYVSPTASSGYNLALNVAAKRLTAGQWYNFRIAFDPNSGHVMGYIDNVLVCDYNINDVYVDTSGSPLGVTKNPTQMYIELASQYQASAIKINDSCFDNVRIRTLNYKEYTKTFLSDADFNNMAAGALTADSFAKATGLYSKSLVGEFTVAGTAGSRYVTASVKAGDGIAVDMTNGYAPLAADVVAFEGNFTLTALGADGMLDIYSLKRGEKEAVSLLSVDNNGKLYLGATATDKVLNTDEIYTVKLVFSGISGTGELYVNDEFITAAPIVAQADLPTLTYTDGLGNTVYVGNKKFLANESATVKTLSGVMLRSTEMPDPTKVAYPEDVLNFLSVEGSGTWGLVVDDLSITRDGAAYIYSDSVSTAYEFTDKNSRLWGNGFIAELTYSGSTTEITSLVDWTLGTTATSLVKVGGGKLYAADGTTELATLGEDANIAVAVTSNYWESHIVATNYDINATVYVDGDVVGTYTVVKSSATSSGALKFAEGASDVKVYFGTALRDNRTPADASGVKFEGYNAFSVTFEDASFFDNAESNTVNYVEWAYSDRDKTVTDWEGATVKLSEHITDGGNSFFRIRRPELSGKPVAYMEYNLGAMGEYIDLYSVQMELRYTDNIASSLDIATVFDKNMSGKLTLLSVDYESKLYFENNGIRYYLCSNGGKNLTVRLPLLSTTHREHILFG